MYAYTPCSINFHDLYGSFICLQVLQRVITLASSLERNAVGSVKFARELDSNFARVSCVCVCAALRARLTLKATVNFWKFIMFAIAPHVLIVHDALHVTHKLRQYWCMVRTWLFKTRDCGLYALRVIALYIWCLLEFIVPVKMFTCFLEFIYLIDSSSIHKRTHIFVTWRCCNQTSVLPLFS